MKFSLIMATLGRSREIEVFLEKLKTQTYRCFELIIVDQNQDNRVFDIYSRYNGFFPIKYLRSDRTGLSVNRNIALDNCDGDIVAFPDDDCEYTAETLEKIFKFFDRNKDFGFYTCNTKDKISSDSIFNGPEFNTPVTLKNFMYTAISFTIFVRSGIMQGFRFDEQLGVGAVYGSGEESDLLLFLLKNKNSGFYHAGDFIYHPFKALDAERAFYYGKGYGALHKKAVVSYRLYLVLFSFLFVLLKESFKIVFYPFSPLRIATMKGRIYGFMRYKPAKRLIHA
jgi:glycosyltransferase involved in cell wall biosynthesis